MSSESAGILANFPQCSVCKTLLFTGNICLSCFKMLPVTQREDVVIGESYRISDSKEQQEQQEQKEQSAQADVASIGLKFDSEKNRLDLLSFIALEETAKILTEGAKKYAERNWEMGINYNRLYRAAIGHLISWWNGEDLDSESGKNHLAHAHCCIMFLLHYELLKEKYKHFDNRPKHRLQTNQQVK